ncbi:ABC transporter permease [Lichenihabitans sp. Uapishka_5]|uniref:ABC transporter permease n=1 Tax=Lichenihabitans sp. Uapishka_5 TaxID=3037302 RepID=UPI0029E7FE43|nr:ABC transporter permease [Lichenihabitans sp. Uapishka_5]MDX7951219.1 ABC transporter permease [Lichenihabitans sp. Uapishka_5]
MTSRRLLVLAERLLPALTLALLLAAIFHQQPRAMSYFGLNLLLNLAVPIVFATLAQMVVIAVNDLDLSIGAYVSLVACIGATLLVQTPWLGVLALLGAVVLYAAVGALIAWRGLPSIVVTLGLSFVWLGLAVTVLPTPGGHAPAWLATTMGWKPPLAPLALWIAAVVSLVGWFAVTRSSLGVVLRGAGGNARSVARAGWSLMAIRVAVYATAGILGLLSGLSLLGLTTSGDANIASRYTLISIASVILGGASFVGGRVFPVGAVLGAMTLTLAASFLTFMRISPDWQVGAQGLILIAVLAIRAVLARGKEAAP